MAADLTIPKGDCGYYINFTVKDSAGTAYNITGYTVKFKVWKVSSPGTLKVNGTCAAVVPASGTCRYLIVATDFTQVGQYVWELELTSVGVVESTTTYTLEVVDSG